MLPINFFPVAYLQDEYSRHLIVDLENDTKIVCSVPVNVDRTAKLLHAWSPGIFAQLVDVLYHPLLVCPLKLLDLSPCCGCIAYIVGHRSEAKLPL